MPTWIILMIRSVTLTKAKRHHANKQLPYPPYIKETNFDVHIRVFRATIWVNGEMEDEDFVNLFIFTLYVTQSWKGVRISLQNVSTTFLQSWNMHFANSSNLSRVMNVYQCSSRRSKKTTQKEGRCIMNDWWNWPIVYKQKWFIVFYYNI